MLADLIFFRLREDNDKTKKDVSLLQVMKDIIFILIELY